MNNEDIVSHLDQQRWLMNNGFIPDSVKNQLFFYGSLVHKEVCAVHVSINAEKKLVSYDIFLNKKTLKKVNKFKSLSEKDDIISLWRVNRLLKKEGDLNFQRVLNKFVKDYCGPKWSAEVKSLDFDEYTDQPEEQFGENWQFNQLPNEQ